MTEALYYKYWGKARSNDENGPAYHLLPYHCLDVAAVGWFILDSDQAMCRQLAKQLQVKPEWLRTLFVFCLALHDLGKFARAFQGLKPNLSPDLVKAKINMPYSERHDSLGFWIWIKAIHPTLAKEFSLDAQIGLDMNKCLPNLEPWLEILPLEEGQLIYSSQHGFIG